MLTVGNKINVKIERMMRKRMDSSMKRIKRMGGVKGIKRVKTEKTVKRKERVKRK
jgi:hypothetical protein